MLYRVFHQGVLPISIAHKSCFVVDATLRKQ
jgi:hypothetical protein